MLEIKSIAVLLLASLVGFGSLTAQAIGIKAITSESGTVSVTYNAFPGEGNDWKFTVSKSDGFQPGDWVDFDLLDSGGVSVASDFEYLDYFGAGKSSIEFTVLVRGASALSSGVTIEVNIDPFDYESVDSNYKIPMDMSVFPVAPSIGDFVKFSKTTYRLYRPQNCEYEAISLDIYDPYSEISSLDVALVSKTGKEIASDYVLIDRDLNTNLASLMLCPSDFPAGGNYDLIAKILWASSGKAPLEVKAKVVISDFSENATLAIAKLKKFCVKGKTFKSSSTGKCSSGFKAATFKTPSVKQWNALTRNPSGSTNGNFRVFGCIAQFDSVTGSSKFRAYSSRIESASYYAETNSFLKGLSSQLLSFSEGDAFVANVTVIGKYSYSSLFGGKTSVPNFQIRDIKQVGTC